MASAGCVGVLCAFLSDEDLRTVLEQHVIGKSQQTDTLGVYAHV